MPVDINQLFNTLQGRLERNPDAVKNLNAKFQINVTGAGAWNVNATPPSPTVTEGTGPAQCTITVGADDFQKLLENPALGAQLFFSGKLKVIGDPMLTQKLNTLFALS